MAEDGARRYWYLAPEDVEVGAADGAHGDAHEDVGGLFDLGLGYVFQLHAVGALEG